MKTYQEMLRTILDSSGWSQQQLAVKLGVSFPTVNYWLNNKVTPRPRMQERIKSLYLARNVPYEGPTYITLYPARENLKIGDEIILTKTMEDGLDDYEVIGVRREDFLAETPDPMPEDYDISIHVANTVDKIAKGTKPGFRIYSKINFGAYARVMFILGGAAIAVIEDWGLEFNDEPDSVPSFRDL